MAELQQIQKTSRSHTDIPTFLSHGEQSSVQQMKEQTSSSVISDSQATYTYNLDDPKHLLLNSSDRLLETAKLRGLIDKLTAQKYFTKYECAEAAGKHRERLESIGWSPNPILLIALTDRPQLVDDNHDDPESGAEAPQSGRQLLDNQEITLEFMEPSPMFPIHGDFIGRLRTDFTAPIAPPPPHPQPAAIAQLAPVHLANAADEPQLEGQPVLGHTEHPPIEAIPLQPIILPRFIRLHRRLHRRLVAIPNRTSVNPVDVSLEEENDEHYFNGDAGASDEEDEELNEENYEVHAAPLPIGGPGPLLVHLPGPVNLHQHLQIATLPDPPNFGVGHPPLLMQPSPAP